MPILNWLTRDNDIRHAYRLPHRLLIDDANVSYGDGGANLLIQGDNLESLKALLPIYAGRVKCIFIDPPYNTGSAFSHYDDALEHSKWIGTMYPRLQLLKEFLCDGGSIWVTIDDYESHYLKVIMDEIFSRKNFIANIVWQKRTSRENRKAIGSAHDHILVYSTKPADKWKAHRNLEPDSGAGYANPDLDPQGRWRSIPFSAQGFRKNQMYKITTPTGMVLDPPKGRCWGATEPEFKKFLSDGRVYWPKNGNGRPRIKKYEWEDTGLVPMTWWTAAESGDNQAAKKEILALFDDEEVFSTPKPEKLIQRIIKIATDPGDIVLDSFLGSGTTAAVAHKMGRQWIGIEVGEHARTYCAARLKKVVDGEQGGISGDEGWKGGGGFRFCTLGPAIFDENGHIDPSIKFRDLARYVWFSETKRPMASNANGTVIGVDGDKAFALLYNGILADRTEEGGNVLTTNTLRLIQDDLAKVAPYFSGELVVFAAASRLGLNRHKSERIIFKQTPYDIVVRG